MKRMNLKALAVAGLLLFAANYCCAEQELLMRNSVGALLIKPSEYFDLTKNTILSHEQGKERVLLVKKVFGSTEEYDRQLDVFAAAEIDSIAEEYMRATDGYLATTAMWIYYSAMAEARGDKSPIRVLNEIHLPNGRRVQMPLQMANLVYGWTMSEIEKSSEKKMKPVSVAGKYRATTKGSCPFADADVEVKQAGFNVEGQLNDKLLLWGRVGEKQMYIQLAEVKYAEIYGPREKATINFPSRPSDIYKADIKPDELVFAGMHYKECVLVLRK